MEIALSNIKLKNKTVVLDIDGVLLADRNDEVALDAVAETARLKQENQVYLLSNNLNKNRSRKIAKQLELDLIETKYRKPSPKTLEGIKVKYPLVVIGDKWWTDGRFAKNINASFIKTTRIKASNDRWYIKLSYRLDDLLWSWCQKIH